MPLETLALFVLASAALSFSPGTDNLFVLMQSTRHGVKAGLAITLGLCTGLLVHTAAVALGVAALLQASPFAFTVLKVIGALYLLVLAWQAFMAAQQKAGQIASEKLSLLKLYKRGIMLNVSNPKVSVFFLAFLPQFTDAAYGPTVQQLLLLGVVFIAVTAVTFSSIAWLASTLGQSLLASPQRQALLNKITAVLFTLLAVKLLLTPLS